jgi:hypothetical protein
MFELEAIANKKVMPEIKGPAASDWFFAGYHHFSHLFTHFSPCFSRVHR